MSFGSNGRPARHGVGWYAAALSADGNVVTLGWRKRGLLHVGRYLPSGALDATFGRRGIVKLNQGPNPAYDALYAGGTIGVQSTGKIVLVYRDLGADAHAVLRLLSDGTIDTGFGVGGKVVLSGGSDRNYNRDAGFAVGADDTIVVSSGAGIVRLLPDGAPDPGCGTAGVAQANAALPAFDTAQLVARADGSVVAIGTDLCEAPFNTCLNRTRFVRLQPDGTLDPGFGAAGELAYASVANPYSSAFAMAVQPGGEILFSGSTYVGPLQSAALTTRLLADGTLDTSFGQSGEVETQVGDPLDLMFAVAIQGDGKIVAGGYSQHVRRGPDTVEPLLIRYLP